MTELRNHEKTRNEANQLLITSNKLPMTDGEDIESWVG